MYCAVALVGKGCEMGTGGNCGWWRLRETAGNVLCSGFGGKRV